MPTSSTRATVKRMTATRSISSPTRAAQDRDAANRDGSDYRRALRAIDTRDRELQSRMLAFDTNLQRAKVLIESNSRTEHWGKAPERAWSWHAASRREASGTRGSRRS
jgi:hypothetical protein